MLATNYNILVLVVSFLQLFKKLIPTSVVLRCSFIQCSVMIKLARITNYFFKMQKIHSPKYIKIHSPFQDYNHLVTDTLINLHKIVLKPLFISPLSVKHFYSIFKIQASPRKRFPVITILRLS